jgi:galactonate dehydratase
MNTEVHDLRAGAGRGLRIRSVEPFSLLVPTEPRSTVWTYAKITTEEGIVGFGEGIGTPGPICAAIQYFGNSLVGESAWDIERLWAAMYRATGFTRGGAIQAAISAIDIALWDIVGKRTNLPVYALLGGKVNPRIPIYHHPWDHVPGVRAFGRGEPPTGYIEATRQLVEEGIIAGKLDPFPRELRFNREISQRALDHAVSIVQQIREGGGPQYKICVEMHARFNVASAIRIAKALEPYNPFWIEEPVPPESMDDMREVQRATSLPVATGERFYQRTDFRDALEKRICRIIQPDIAHVGGITEMKKIATMADAYYVTVAPHEYNGPITLAAGAHVGATLTNLLMHEFHIQLTGVLQETMSGGYVYDPQFFDVPEMPGIGIELSDEYIREHRIDPAEWGTAEVGRRLRLH